MKEQKPNINHLLVTEPEDMLQLCFLLWEYLYNFLGHESVQKNHPENVKDKALRDLGYTGPLTHSCPCCAYMRDRDGELDVFACEKDCPMVEHWDATMEAYHKDLGTNLDIESCTDMPCEREGTSFDRWKRAESDDERRAAAKEIADAAFEAWQAY